MTATKLRGFRDLAAGDAGADRLPLAVSVNELAESAFRRFTISLTRDRQVCHAGVAGRPSRHLKQDKGIR